MGNGDQCPQPMERQNKEQGNGCHTAVSPVLAESIPAGHQQQFQQDIRYTSCDTEQGSSQKQVDGHLTSPCPATLSAPRGLSPQSAAKNFVTEP